MTEYIMTTGKKVRGAAEVTKTQTQTHNPDYNATGTLSPNSQDPYGRDHRATSGTSERNGAGRLQGGGGQSQSGPRARWW
jgi:hypothetical protein